MRASDVARRRGGVILLAALLVQPALADDREHAQLRQMQMQLQRLTQDNQSLTREKTELQSKVGDAEQTKAKLEAASREASRLKAKEAAARKDLDDARAEIDRGKSALAAANAQLAKLTLDMQQHDEAAVQALKLRDGRIQALDAQLGRQTGRAELCERKHAELMTFSASMIDRYEHERLHGVVDFVTGISKVSRENEIQRLRDQLFGLRLDVPAGASN